jgi:hypothetical protein
MPDSLRASMRTTPTAVLFTDDVGSIRMIAGHFNLPGAARAGETLRYSDAWDTRPTLTTVHTEELARLGFTVTSTYTLIGAQTVAALTRAGRDDRAMNYEVVPVVTSALASALEEHGQRFLFWVTWSGLDYFYVSAGPSVEQINSSYWLFDLSTGKLVWSSGLADVRDSRFKGADATAQLGRDQFAVFFRGAAPPTVVRLE